MTIILTARWDTESKSRDARGHNSAYGIGCVIDTVRRQHCQVKDKASDCQACSCAKARFGGSDTAKLHAWFHSHWPCP